MFFHSRSFSFDNYKKHKFIYLEFQTLLAYKKTKYLWYTKNKDNEMCMIRGGLNYNRKNLQLYEANILPLLRFLHIRKLSPSGWITFPKKNAYQIGRAHV